MLQYRKLIVYFILIFVLIFFFFREKRFRTESLSDWTWPFVYTVNAISGLAFLYVYTYIEGDGSLSQDAGAYIQESKILQDVFFESPIDYIKLLFGFGDTDALTQQYLIETNHWDVGSQAISNESRNIIRLHSILQFISFNEPVIHVLFMSLISTLSGIFLFRTVSGSTKMNSTAAVALLCFLPNVLFWSNGILKEPLYLLGFSLIVYSIFSERNGIQTWGAFMLGILLLLSFKFHFLVVTLLGLSVWTLSKFFVRRKILLTSIISLSAVILLFSFSGSLRGKVLNTVARKQFDFKNISQGGLHADTDSCFYFFAQDQLGDLNIEGDSVSTSTKTYALRLEYNKIWPPDTIQLSGEDGNWKKHFMRPKSDSFFELADINSSFGHLISAAPEALRNSFFRPLIWEPGGLFKWVSIIELTLVWILFIISLKWSLSMNDRSKELFLFLGVVILLSSLLIGWTTPVSGAIVRYRVPIHICMILMVLINWKQKKKSHE